MTSYSMSETSEFLINVAFQLVIFNYEYEWKLFLIVSDELFLLIQLSMIRKRNMIIWFLKPKMHNVSSMLIHIKHVLF